MAGSRQTRQRQGGTRGHHGHPLEGYRRLTYMMMDADVVAVSPSSVYRVPREAFREVHPRVISDNGPQFVARDFREFIRLCGMTHVRTSPYYPQSNGKLERYHRTIKHQCLRPGVPLSLADARRIVDRFVVEYNTARLHSGIGYVTPADKLAGRAEAIWAERERKLAEARQARRARRAKQHALPPSPWMTRAQAELFTKTTRPTYPTEVLVQFTLNQYRTTNSVSLYPGVPTSC